MNFFLKRINFFAFCFIEKPTGESKIIKKSILKIIVDVLDGDPLVV